MTAVFATCGTSCPVPCDGRCRAPVPPVARVVRVSDVKAERVSWLWSGYIPQGKVTLIDGDPGDAKSTLSLDLSARVTTGKPMPDGSAGTLGNVLLLSAEDGIGDTIRPRLDAAGADTTRVIVLHEIEEDGKVRPPELPADVDHMARLIREHDIVLVVIDPLMAFLAGVDSHNDQSVRRALHPLSKLADISGAAILVIRHLNKASGGKALYRGGGSIGISGAARAVFLVAHDPEDDDRRLLASVKVNIAVKPLTMAYRIVGDDLHGCSRISWEGTVSATADELVAAGNPDDREERADAAAWLRSYLTDNGGEAEAADVLKAGDKNGFSKDSLKNAKKKAGVVSRKEAFDAGWMWVLQLPEGSTKGAKGATP